MSQDESFKKSLHHDDLAIKGLTKTYTQSPVQRQHSMFDVETDHTKLQSKKGQFYILDSLEYRFVMQTVSCFQSL